MTAPVRRGDVFGFVRPALDAHTLGVFAAAQLLEDCGFRVVVAGQALCEALERPEDPASLRLLRAWIEQHDVRHLAFSFRLDPARGAALFSRWVRVLDASGHAPQLYFAGLPDAAAQVAERFEGRVPTFRGDESPQETLERIGVPRELFPGALVEHTRYDNALLEFGRDLLARGDAFSVKPPEPGAYPEFGSERDTLALRLRDRGRRGDLPLTRAHAGPYEPDRKAAVERFASWAHELGAGGYLDVLSLGTSQLTQSSFGQAWGDRPNGGGVPLNSREEFARIWAAARPMLVRTYAGTNDIVRLAAMYEETIHAAWHALSIWWFNRMDGRGPLPLEESLRQHVETIRAVAAMGRPFEANVAHHFAFRGADDVSYVASAVLGARLAKRMGIRLFVLQTMLNTPRGTWGVQDLAKARALLHLTRELEDDTFEVCLQPRAGLDLFSPDLDTARAQLAAVAALMDDIEPDDASSPPIVHVVSYSEASFLATPAVIQESIQITRLALDAYRDLRRRGLVEHMGHDDEVRARTRELVEGARAVLAGIEASVRDPLSPEGLVRAFAAGFLPVPYLWECRDEFPEAVRRPTRLVAGSVCCVDEAGAIVDPKVRAEEAAAFARGLS